MLGIKMGLTDLSKVIAACVIVFLLYHFLSSNKSRGAPGVMRGFFRNIKTIALWQQCGGKGGDCAKHNACVDAPWRMTTCGPGAVAVRHNEWHWQCEPVGSQPAVAAATRQLGWGEQCGGKGGDCGKKGQCVDGVWQGVKCPQFSACVRRNEWHWQCDPEPKPGAQPRPPAPQSVTKTPQQAQAAGSTNKPFAPPPELSKARLVLKWSDEFRSPKVDEAKWEFHEGDGTDWTGVKGWGNQEMQCYTKQNARIENTVLVITAKRGGTCRNAKNNTAADASVTSAKLASRQAFVFGANPILVSARIKIPMGQGSFPAFWLIPNRPWSSGTGAYGYWCLSGEIDILEHVNKEKHVQSTVIHKLPEDPQCKFDRQGMDLANPDEWHVYSCLWSQNEIKTWVDGRPMLTKQTGFGRPFTADNPMNIVLNLAVGGNWAGNDASDLPYSMYVDYVYVHEVQN